MEPANKIDNNGVLAEDNAEGELVRRINEVKGRRVHLVSRKPLWQGINHDVFLLGLQYLSENEPAGREFYLIEKRFVESKGRNGRPVDVSGTNEDRKDSLEVESSFSKAANHKSSLAKRPNLFPEVIDYDFRNRVLILEYLGEPNGSSSLTLEHALVNKHPYAEKFVKETLSALARGHAYFKSLSEGGGIVDNDEGSEASAVRIKPVRGLKVKDVTTMFMHYIEGRRKHKGLTPLDEDQKTYIRRLFGKTLGSYLCDFSDRHVVLYDLYPGHVFISFDEQDKTVGVKFIDTKPRRHLCQVDLAGVVGSPFILNLDSEALKLGKNGYMEGLVKQYFTDELAFLVTECTGRSPPKIPFSGERFSRFMRGFYASLFDRGIRAAAVAGEIRTGHPDLFSRYHQINPKYAVYEEGSPHIATYGLNMLMYNSERFQIDRPDYNRLSLLKAALEQAQIIPPEQQRSNGRKKNTMLENLAACL